MKQNSIRLIFVLIPLLFFASCKKSAQRTGPPPLPVMAALVERKDIPLQLETVGNVQAYQTVSVKALVAGEILAVHFQEGQDVKKGDLLFTIDPRPFQLDLEKNEANLSKDTAAVRQSEANLKKDIAQSRYAESQAKRYEALVSHGYVSREQAEERKTNAEAQDATVRADEAALQTARDTLGIDRSAVANSKLNLQYCSIRSPLDGRTGSILLHAGNLVKANDQPYLVVINQITPIYVTFTVPEKDLPDIRGAMNAGPIRVEAVTPNSKETEIGKISFVNNTVSTTSGTVTLKGIFSNENRKLWPGEFVNVKIELTVQKNAVVIPSEAVQTGQQGSYVFVIGPDMTVRMVPVEVDRTFENLSVIRRGLSPSERVVTDGQLGLVPGSTVVLKDQ